MTNFRIQIVGTSGSGKTTLARLIAEQLAITHLELDSIKHQANWQSIEPNEMIRQVTDFAQSENWVIDGNYSALRQCLDRRITHLIWLDYPRWFVMLRLIRRTLSRAILRKKLWNGNRERVRSWFSKDPLENVVLWAFVSHKRNRLRYTALFQDLPGVVKIRIGSPLRVNRFLRELND